MRLKPACILLGLLLLIPTVALSGEDAITIGQWRTEPGKSLVCGGTEGKTIIDIATRANAFYASGSPTSSAEYNDYWSHLERAFEERRCFVTAKMRHMPDSLIYAGPEALEPLGKRFKVLGTTIEEDGERYPAFTMTTFEVKNP